MKNKIIHFIFNLGRGGAETMLVRVIKELPEYEHVVVTLFSTNNFGEELQCDKLIDIKLSSLFSLPLAIFKFRKIVKKEKPAIVHTHLFWPTVIARLSVNKKIPLITTIHAFIASSLEYKNWYVSFLDKLTYRRRKNTIIGVARQATAEYFSFLKLTPYKAYTLYTFVDINQFNKDNAIPKLPTPAFKVIAIGALRQQKNYAYAIQAFEKLKAHNIELHIYGTGNLQQELQQQIDTSGVKVILKGEVKNIQDIIPQYDLYLMTSTYEGFSLSVLEAMAMGMPLLLSDIISFREQCEEAANYFSLNNAEELSQKLIALSNTSAQTLQAMGEEGRQRAINNFTLPQHIEGLRNIYTEALYTAS